MDGDYIELTQTDHKIDVLALLIELLRPVVLDGGRRCFPMLTLEYGIELIVDECDEDLVRLAIAGRDPARRRVAAAWVYRTLVERTGWGLCWTADDVAGVIEQRLFPTASSMLTAAN